MPEFAFKLNVDLPERERRDVERVLPALTASLVELRRAKIRANEEQLIEMFLGDVQPTPLDMQSARLQANARRAVFTGSPWLTAAEIGELANLGPANPIGTVSRWKQQGRIFALRRDGRDYFPQYALGADFRPQPAMVDIIGTLHGFSGERLAAWFESTSSFLGGQRPRELLATEPDRVLAAARDALEAEESLG